MNTCRRRLLGVLTANPGTVQPILVICRGEVKPLLSPEGDPCGALLRDPGAAYSDIKEAYRDKHRRRVLHQMHLD
jgi:hypothetical protein